MQTQKTIETTMPLPVNRIFEMVEKQKDELLLIDEIVESILSYLDEDDSFGIDTTLTPSQSFAGFSSQL